MARFWKTLFGFDRKPDPEAVKLLEESEQELTDVRSQEDQVNNVSGYLATRRQRNHFGDALTISFTPRSRHV